jgi:hypothetical protein
VFLLLCAPVAVDLLFGATQASTVIALLPENLRYGCATLLIRGLARHRNAGWATVIRAAHRRCAAGGLRRRRTAVPVVPSSAVDGPAPAGGHHRRPHRQHGRRIPA